MRIPKYIYAEMLNHDFITKITQITAHERNGVLDELSENSKKVRYFKTCVCTWVIELFPQWLVLLHGLLARTIY